jgi:hypothetical protein
MDTESSTPSTILSSIARTYINQRRHFTKSRDWTAMLCHKPLQALTSHIDKPSPQGLRQRDSGGLPAWSRPAHMQPTPCPAYTHSNEAGPRFSEANCIFQESTRGKQIIRAWACLAGLDNLANYQMDPPAPTAINDKVLTNTAINSPTRATSTLVCYQPCKLRESQRWRST